MKLEEVSISNFRGYREKTTIAIDEAITGIVGKNDAGKSSILAALDIFFAGGQEPLSKDDLNVVTGGDYVEIACVFSDLPDRIVLDESTETTFADEYLLQEDGRLCILKRFTPGARQPKVFIAACHPVGSEVADLHSLKMTDLRKRAATADVPDDDVEDKRKASHWRQAIWQNAESLDCADAELEISKFAADSKAIHDKIESQLPLFALFRSDRESKDSDDHAKGPLQEAVRQAKAELKDAIGDLEDQIKQRVLERANATIEKLREMDPQLADGLIPRFKSPPKWSFDFNLDGDDGIPINKRGSGVRRLVLLNFFRAEAERKVVEKDAPSVIYAIEEPETSQHPSNQEMLIDSLQSLSERENCQVLLTTHVPALAGRLPVEGLRLVQKTTTGSSVEHGTEGVYERIAQSLGVYPEQQISTAKALVLVEGPGDVVFLHHTARTLRDGGFLSTALEDEGIVPIWIGGCGNLKHWVTKKLAEQFRIPWGILLDSDLGTPEEPKNRDQIATLRNEGVQAFLTRRREPENYLVAEAVTDDPKLRSKLNFSETCDAKKIIGTVMTKRKSDVLEHYWPQMTCDQIRATERYVDDDGEEHFELTEILQAFLGLV